MNAITVKLATFGAEPAELHRRPLHRLPRDRAPTNSCSTTDHNIVLQPALVIRGTTAEATGAAVDGTVRIFVCGALIVFSVQGDAVAVEHG
jgi:hypothetical protein